MSSFSGSYKAVCLVFSIYFCIFLVSGASNSDVKVLRGLGEVDSNTGYRSPIPLPVSGSCNAGESYIITSLNQLYDNAKDLECIFAAGLEPKNVPLGFGYGYVLAVANTGFWSPLIQIPYQGDYVVKTMCRGNFYNIGWLSVAGLDVGTSVWSIDNLNWDLAEGEYPEGEKKSILMDFTVDCSALCAPEGNESPLGLKGFSPFSATVFPMNAFKDVGRIVGVDTDGATILLNKAFIRSETHGAQTVLIYAIKTFDESVRPDGFSPGDGIVVGPGPNGEDVIEYKRGSVAEVGIKALENLFDLSKLSRSVAQRDAKRDSMFLKNLPLLQIPSTAVDHISPNHFPEFISNAAKLFQGQLKGEHRKDEESFQE